MPKKSKTSGLFVQALEQCAKEKKERKEADVCHSHLLGVCPRHEIKKPSPGKCPYSHPEGFSDCPERRLSAAGRVPGKSALFRLRRLKEEIVQILSEIKRSSQIETHEIEQYKSKEKEIAIFEINGKTELAEIARRELREQGERNARHKSRQMRCAVCPQYLPWKEEEREKHCQGKLHRAYEKMRVFLQRYYSGWFIEEDRP